MNFKKIIQEEIEKVLSEENFLQDIIYLKKFILKNKKLKDNELLWIFEYKTKDYIIRFYINKNLIYNSWKAKVFIYWKRVTKDFTNSRGKEFEQEFGDFCSYNEMKNELNRLLKNNLLISANNFVDHNNTQFDVDVFELLKLLKKNKDNLLSIKDKHFDDLKHMLYQIENINNIKDLKKFINAIAPQERDKQTLLLMLQKIFKIKFYISKEKIESY